MVKGVLIAMVLLVGTALAHTDSVNDSANCSGAKVNCSATHYVMLRPGQVRRLARQEARMAYREARMAYREALRCSVARCASPIARCAAPMSCCTSH